MEKLRQIVGDEIFIVEDASQALGATYKGKKIGTTGSDITAFRFSPQMKNAIASGGVMTTNDDQLMERAKLLRKGINKIRFFKRL